MNVSREQVSLALFNLLSTNTSLKPLVRTFTRVPRMWNDVGEGDKPQLLLFKGGPATEYFEQSQNQRIALTKYMVAYNLWLYVTADVTGKAVVETVINNIADGIDAAMHVNALGERQTLGGIVNNAWIDGGNEWSREFQDANIVVMWRIVVETGI
jgi:hypothetical protein